MAEGTTAAAGALTDLLMDEDKIHRSLVPDDVVIRDYLSCINDDTWVRHAELVQLSDLKDTPHEEVVKEEVLRSFIEERRRSGIEMPRDLIMEGILWQERFMEEYKKDQRSQDKTEASNYKQSLMSKFRTKRSGMGGTTDSTAATRAIEYKQEQAPPPEYPTEDASARDTYHEHPHGDASEAQQELSNDMPKKEEETTVEPAAANDFDRELDMPAAPSPADDHTEPAHQPDQPLQEGPAGKNTNEDPDEAQVSEEQHAAPAEPAHQPGDDGDAAPTDVTQDAAEYPCEEGASAEQPTHQGEAATPNAEDPNGMEYPVEDGPPPLKDPAEEVVEQPVSDANAAEDTEEM